MENVEKMNNLMEEWAEILHCEQSEIPVKMARLYEIAEEINVVGPLATKELNPQDKQ